MATNESLQPKKRNKKRLVSRRAALIWFALGVIYCTFSVWFVHHPWQWLVKYERALPSALINPILSCGYYFGDITDAIGLTGHDAVYEYDVEAPVGSIVFAGLPRKIGNQAPDDIVILDRKEFKVGYSPSLRHPVWCAYHVTPKASWPDGERPDFRKDNSVKNSPNASDYKGSGYDRGHMVPNHAMISRYGEDVQKLSFLMSNIAPQTASLNQGVWRNIEHRIADLWTARYGEIWVIVGCVPGIKKFNDIDIPDKYYQVIVAQEGMNVRALAMIFPQNIPMRAWAVRNIISIDDLERITGFDFLPELPEFIQTPLEAELPTRLWPTRFSDIFKLFAILEN